MSESRLLEVRQDGFGTGDRIIVADKVLEIVDFSTARASVSRRLVTLR
ncbi:MAG: hypothetical protein ACLSG5_17220 [Oscillospiraceae bacterium]